MKLLLLFSILALSFAIPGYAHRGCRYGRRCGVGYGESIDAGSEASANGIFTRTGGRSTVETDSFGSRGRTEYFGQGIGSGPTSAGGRGTVRSSSPYRSSGINVASGGSAYGSHFSHVKADGTAEVNNGYSRGAAGAEAQASGRFHSNSRTHASASQFGFRSKRHAGYPGDSISAGAKSDAFGVFTDTASNSAVESGPYGTRGRVSHRAGAHGHGLSAVASGGGIDVDTSYGGHSTQSKGEAQAYGGNSYAVSQGGAETLNYNSHSGAQAASGSFGYGGSSSSSRVSAGQHYRHKRCITCGFDINAHTNAHTNGHVTNTHGTSSVNSGTFGVHGDVRHGAKGVGRYFTDAASEGVISVGGCLDCRSGVHTAGRSSAYGNVHSHASTQGHGAYHSGYSRGSMYSSSGAVGSGTASSSSRASAGRFKRHSGPGDFTYIKGINAGSRGGSTGLQTESVGDSSVFSEGGRIGGWSKHKAIGFGPGPTGANSWSGIDVEDVYGRHGTLQAGGNVRAIGEQSLSSTRTGTKFENGRTLSLAESTGQASGKYHSAAHSEAGVTRSKRSASTSGEIFLNEKTAKVPEGGHGSAAVIEDHTGVSAFDLTKEDGFGLTSISTSKGFENERGTAGGHLNTRGPFGQNRIATDELFTEAFGEGSISQSVAKIDERKGHSFAISRSSAHVEGDNGYSSARSHTSSDGEGFF